MKIIDNYEIDFENTTIPILIYETRKDFVGTYEVGILETGEYTKYIIEKIKEDLLREGIADFKEKEISYVELKKMYIKKVNELLKYYLNAETV